MSGTAVCVPGAQGGMPTISLEFPMSEKQCWHCITAVHTWRKLPRKVSYKRTFGASDQDHMLDVWGDSCQADVNLEVLVLVMSPSQPAEIFNKKDITG